jgi:hypothetical protein
MAQMQAFDRGGGPQLKPLLADPQVDAQQVAVDHQGVGHGVVFELRRVIEGRQVQVRACRLEGAAVEHQPAPPADHAALAGALQQAAQGAQVEVRVAFALQHQVAVQHPLVHAALRQQAGSRPEGWPQLFQRHKGCHQFHRRTRLQRPLGGMGDEAWAGARRRDDQAEGLRRQARLGEDTSHFRRQRGAGREGGKRGGQRQRQGAQGARQSGQGHDGVGRVGRLRAFPGRARRQGPAV